MSDLGVTSVTVEEILKKLLSREWLVPQFQREFVWSVSDVIDLVHSILYARPIGMATLWAQGDDSALNLGAISLPDRTAEDGQPKEVTFTSAESNPKKVYAILDGRQRVTAIAMAFGGFHTEYGSYRFSGRYFLDVSQTDALKQIVFKKEKEVKQKGYDKDATCISDGLFPLSTNQPGEAILAQWMRYIQNIPDPSYYSDGKLPDAKELERRNSILKRAFDGIIKTKLAVYIVPELYDLSDICEIFETLNTTGTKVSTTDLIHSWLFSDTQLDPEAPIVLRDWMAEFGQKDGALGWVSPGDRPELTVQIATACYVALDSKPPHRKVKGIGPAGITSIGAADLLATPTSHWRNLLLHEVRIAEYLGDFQRVVAGGSFPHVSCPYPMTSALYVALRYHASLETHEWGEDDLNAVFSAYFWRNALTRRYDQGVVTQFGADLKQLKKWLNMRKSFQSSSGWADKIRPELDTYIQFKLPDEAELIGYLTDGVQAGALHRALTLPMKAQAANDLLDKSKRISFPEVATGAEMHHIYPRAWCLSNKVGALADILDKDKAGKDWINSVANLMPLERQSNNLWKAKVPALVLTEKGISYENSGAILQAAYIDEQCFEYLKEGSKHIREFWEQRAMLIAKDLLARTKLVV